MESSNAEILLQGVKLAIVGMGMVGVLLSFLVFIISITSKLQSKRADDAPDTDTVAAIIVGIMKYREKFKL
ncbi:MAG: hypothetical protein VX086_01915 [Pseudomonadota bacterium]|nr:hypothetical protein [Pseudomonadota bacterium]